MSGWISLHRQIQEHWLWKEKRELSKFEAWTDILLNANHSEARVVIKNTVYNIGRGESIMSLKNWADRWNWSRSRVKRFLSLLEKDEMIRMKSDTNTTHLTICKYEDYQVKRNDDETKVNIKRTSDEHQTATNNKNNNNNNITIRKLNFVNQVSLLDYDVTLKKEFCDYWTEPNKSNTKMKFELNKTWKTELRLKTWAANQKKWDKPKTMSKLDAQINVWQKAKELL